MLLKSQISDIAIHSDDWFAGRLAKFTSSEFHFLMGTDGIGSAGTNYIYRKVGEELTGIPCRKEISTEATEHGLEYEPENLREFGKKMGIEFLVTQKLIIDPNGRVGSTPDAIWPIKERIDQTGWDVYNVEAKCPTAYDNFIHLWNCETPADVKKKNKIYYWQVLHQMKVCGALKGYLSIYNPFFKAGKLNIVEFRQIDLVTEFTLMEKRTQEAIKIFTEQRDKMINQ
jgi:hypothetical protein